MKQLEKTGKQTRALLPGRLLVVVMTLGCSLVLSACSAMQLRSTINKCTEKRVKSAGKNLSLTSDHCTSLFNNARHSRFIALEKVSRAQLDRENEQIMVLIMFCKSKENRARVESLILKRRDVNNAYAEYICTRDLHDARKKHLEVDESNAFYAKVKEAAKAVVRALWEHDSSIPRFGI